MLAPIMLAPIPRGVLTRRDDPNTPADERLHDGSSRDVGVAGNVQGWPILSLFAGKVITAGTYKGYGLTVRVEGFVLLTKTRILTARAPWPQAIRDHWKRSPDDRVLSLPMRVLYGHHHELWVREGDDVRVFQPLGGMGNTGLSQGNHLHCKARLLELQPPDCFVDPLPLFIYQ